MSEQEWVKPGDDSVGIKEAEFKVLQVFTVTSGLSRSGAWYVVSLFPVCQRCPSILIPLVPDVELRPLTAPES